MNHVHRQLFIDVLLLATALMLAVVLCVSEHVRENSSAGASLLPSTAADDCREVVFRRGSTEIRLSKQRGIESWVRDRPRSSHGNSATIEKAIATLAAISVIRPVERSLARGSNELQRLGLQPPAFVWTIATREQSWTVSFGGKVPGVESGTYVAFSTDESDAQQVLAVNVDRAALDLAPEQLLDPALTRVRELNIAEMRFDSAQGDFHVRRDQNTNHWYDVKPPGTRLDADAVAGLIDALDALKPSTTSGSNSRSGYVTFSGVLRISASSGDETIEFRGACAQVPGMTRIRLTHPGGLGTDDQCVDAAELAPSLMRGLAHDTRLFTLRVDEVESEKVSSHGQVEELSRDGTGFILKQQRSSFVNVDVGNGYLKELLAARGQLASSPHLATVAPSDASDYIRLRSSVVATGDYEETLLIGPVEPNGDRFVRRLDDNAVLRVDTRTAELLRVSHSVMRQASPSRPDAGQEP